MQLVFLIPYYNHPFTIEKLIKILQNYGYDILIVDDGSDEEAKKPLANLNALNLNKQIKKNKLMLFTSPKNQGKGKALKIGFTLASKLGYTHAFCIDADMQHDLSNFAEFIASCEQFKSDIICSRPLYFDDAPRSRLHGRKITNFWVYINTLGADIKDAMCGMRIYPLARMKDLCAKCYTDAMEFDIEILVVAHRLGLKFQWIDTKVSYEKDGISHFKYLKDNIKISKMHARYFFTLPFYIFSKFRKNNE